MKRFGTRLLKNRQDVRIFADDLPDHRRSRVMIGRADDAGGLAALAMTGELLSERSYSCLAGTSETGSGEGRMARWLAYPVNLERQEDGSILVSLPDIPEALTEGATEEEALAETGDCLIAALGGYIQARRAIPRPSAGRGRTVVPLPALVAVKSALYCAMRAEGIGNTALAERLGVSEGAVRRLIDPDHRSHIGQVEAALHALGQRLVIATQAA